MALQVICVKLGVNWFNCSIAKVLCYFNHTHYLSLSIDSVVALEACPIATYERRA